MALGPEVAEGAWRPLKRPDSRFVQRYGTLFEENRGPPMVMRGASFQADPVTGLCKRGQLQPHLGRPLLSLGGRQWYRHHLQAFGSSIEILKVVAYALVLNSPSSSKSWAQVRSNPSPGWLAALAVHRQLEHGGWSPCAQGIAVVHAPAVCRHVLLRLPCMSTPKHVAWLTVCMRAEHHPAVPVGILSGVLARREAPGGAPCPGLCPGSRCPGAGHLRLRHHPAGQARCQLRLCVRLALTACCCVWPSPVRCC